jgi:ribosomal protein S15P/S13E
MMEKPKTKIPKKTIVKKETSKKVTQADYEKKVIELAKAGLTAEKIGEKLRKEGIHPKEYKKKISHILKEKELYKNPDLKNMEAKFEKIVAHADKNKQDKRAKRQKERVYSQIRKLKKYFKIPLK